MADVPMIVSGGTDNSAVVAALLSRRDDDKELDTAIASSVSDLRAEVRDVEADVKDAIQIQTNLINTDTLNLHNRLCESEKAAIESKYESRIETMKVVKDLDIRIDSFEKSTDENFCNLEKQIERGFHKVEERELREEVRELRQQVESQNIISSILSALGVPTPTIAAKKA